MLELLLASENNWLFGFFEKHDMNIVIRSNVKQFSDFWGKIPPAWQSIKIRKSSRGTGLHGLEWKARHDR